MADSEHPTYQWNEPRRVGTTLDYLTTLRLIEVQLAQLPGIRSKVDSLVAEVMGQGEHAGLRADVAALKEAHSRRVWSHPLVVSLLVGCALAITACSLYGALRG
jgi:hypothetical protein